MMQLQIGDKRHGFTVGNVRTIPELNGVLTEMTHDRTGAALCWFNSGEENKLFSVAFKTLPEDDTGVFHILEHSVLNGSDRYPVREPFVELLKGSMNTFLNAMTAPDMTIYPVSSRNERDFLNLTSVYLDAVFAPAIRTNPNIFRQEGWHCEVTGRDAEPVYKGVVFNEMKGALASVDEAVQDGCMRMLYPDSCYQWISGGDPEYIPDLTYEKFLDFYRRFYHPSNARFWLDGDLPIDETLALIDSYLSRFTRSPETHEIPEQKPVPATEFYRQYEISPDEDPADKHQIVLAKLAGTWKDKTQGLAISVLCDAIAGSNEAPLTRAILKGGLGQDVTLSLSDSMSQPYLMLWVRNTEESRYEAIRSTIRDTVRELTEKGISREELEASLNRAAFRLKEPSEPQGLYRNFYALGSWLYGGDPALYLTYDEALNELREKLDTRYFEDLLAQLLLDESDLSVLHLAPSQTLGEEKRLREAERLRQAKNSWTTEQLDALIEENRALAVWQQTPDTPEALATLPTLSLSEVKPEPAPNLSTVDSASGVTVLRHPAPCPGISHLSLYFSIADLSGEELAALNVLLPLLGELPTRRHDAPTLQRLIKLYTGRLDFGTAVFSREETPESCGVYVNVKTSVLDRYLPQATELLKEVLLETDFSAEDKVRESVLQMDDSLRQAVLMSGSTFAVRRARGHWSAEGAFTEITSGLTAVRFVHELAKDFDARKDTLLTLGAQALKKVCCRSRLLLSVTAADPAAVPVQPLIEAWPQGEAAPETASYTVSYPLREGIRIPSQIVYTGAAHHLSKLGIPFDASASVLSVILTYSYLWNTVRVQGGAYGVNGSIGMQGSVSVSSFRDPSARATMAAYRGMAAYIREFCAGDEPLDKFIISTIAHAEPLRTPRMTGALQDSWYFAGIDEEKRRANRRRILTTKKEDLLVWEKALDAVANDGALCIIGYPDALSACESEGLTISEL